ncbi:hypothetical protein ACIBEJ_35135 [Nonomuraea sp. NPDC050790]|uniref:hypothetical protein n=1 Tax=Nonomuraea sp. NPDC050790 TaxID=3364371 RepID=UPI0037883A44
MPLPQPEDFADRIRALEQIVRDLMSSITNQGGLTTASAGWQIPAGSTPDTPDSGGHLFTSGNEPHWKDDGGSVYSLKPQVSPGVPVSDPADFQSAASAGPTYNSAVQNMITQLRADAADTNVQLKALLSSLRGGGAIN